MRTTVRLKSVAFPKGSYDFLANVRGSVSLILAFHFVLTQNETKKSRLQFLPLKIFPFAKLGGRVPAGHFVTNGLFIFIGVCELVVSLLGSQFAKAKAFILKLRN